MITQARISIVVLFSLVVSGSAAQALSDTYKGESAISDEDSGKSCTLTLFRDDKSNDIVSMKLEAPARVLHQDSSNDGTGSVDEVTTGKESRDLSRIKKFSEYRFQRLSDLQGEGFMLRGEKIQKSKKDEKLFIHFDIRDGVFVGVEYAQREQVLSAKTKSATGDRISIEKMCTGLKKL